MPWMWSNGDQLVWHDETGTHSYAARDMAPHELELHVAGIDSSGRFTHQVWCLPTGGALGFIHQFISVSSFSTERTLRAWIVRRPASS